MLKSKSMLDLSKVKTYNLRKRKSKVNAANFCRIPGKDKSFSALYQALPHILKAEDFRSVVEAIVSAHKKKKPVIFMMGAHVIKCGLSPLIIEMMRRKIINCIALNGAGIIHDFELAYQGETSEDVTEELAKGRFGMSRETAEFLNEAINQGVRQGKGIGYSVGEKIGRENLKYKHLSILYNARKYDVPVTVHVAIGTDIIHQHPSFDGAATGKGSQRDFHALVRMVSGLGRGGVVINFGSAVVLPEVFLKALNLARNLGFKVRDFTTATFDMIHHYRPQQNVVHRPVFKSGKGYYIIGHHEIMLPMLAWAINERL
ncbi:MAG: hypothetical protein PHU91_00535 [Candidatus Omnitrophica bacterium]|nr:hypothetical protein [Candidatus Omnitrophota bacterium]MDD5236148.1 hypothetical protein [Candidatus Omnitrophota bacterium]MDD5611353.1 hypothetical protein [Candidatus Omnitrophota bacterium]